MGHDWITRAVAKNLEGCERFFWDAFVALQVNGISGDYAEFGSWGGNTLRLAHAALREMPTPRHMWAFDSFQALPEPTDPRDERWASPVRRNMGQGGVDAFHEECARHGVPREAYTAVEGYYDESLPALGQDGAPTDIALAYVDCNMYSSTVSVLTFLEPRLKHGMIVAFDDYFCWSSTHMSGEQVAVDEFLSEHPQWRFHRYKEIHWGGTSFLVERLGDAAPGVT